MAELAKRQGYQSQDTTNGGLVDYWGYAARVVPCTNDPGTCEYFEAVYGGHERGMLYTGIIWATIGGILLLWAVGRPFLGSEGSSGRAGGLSRLAAAIAASVRAYCLPESFRWIFGRTTRLQVIVLAMLAAYLAIFSFIGITYKEWITPVKGYDNLYQRRSSIGAWSDRVGTLAYALTPFSVLLASRESILSLLTGLPYQSFMFLHRWLGWIIFVQSLAHTIGWTVIETVYYQPQPQVADKWIKQLYMIWGCVAMILIFIMVLLTTPWGIKVTGYEFFRKSHYVLAMVYIGACWGHWQPLKVFMVPGLAIWLVDRGARLFRSWLIHYQYLPDGSMGFQSASGHFTHFEQQDSQSGEVARLDFALAHTPWKPGQHFYLCFPRSSVWQSHPFTPLNLPILEGGSVNHAYIFRAKGGETRKVIQKSIAEKSAGTPVILQGPYGEDHTLHLTPDVNVLCLAGGTGITYVLPTLLWLANQPVGSNRRITLVWAVRRKQDIDWVRGELDVLTAAHKHGIVIDIHVTREEMAQAVDANGDASSCGSGSLNVRSGGHPDIAGIVQGFLAQNIGGRTTVFASGPGGMISDARSAVASANSGRKVWKGDESGDVELVCDNRLE
ncbi:ferric reductase transmembrane component 5 [Plectosphaerella plurivora]|uniref:ferric-chelate reductase (NADPH) n=1 Tax=Plectosphaerella plurivora TaxID=936078 RepID=A0A9P8V7S3_9PEZI|nr:ferric reductase transmembrane component 5 [Plectosphaerella plurivora]